MALSLNCGVALIGREWEEEEEGESKAVGCLYNLHMTVPTDRVHKTVEDDMLNDMCLSAPGSLSISHTN